jgi:hypothetical protein
MPLSHAQLICSWVAITGQLNLSSEWLPGLPPERLDVLKCTMPSHDLRPRPVDLFEHDPPRLWLLTDDRGAVRRDVIGVFNWDDQEHAFDESLDRLGLDGTVEYDAFDYWADERLPVVAHRLQLSVPRQSCRIVAVRPRAAHPQLISTSRHATQGIVDVRDETWDPATRTLRGTSRVVGGDKYELRIVLPAGERWNVGTVAAESAETTWGEKNGLLRVEISSPDAGDINWSVQFLSP